MKPKTTASSQAEPNEDTTHFGYETVKTTDKSHRVADVFHSVASKYDVMNDLMSFGLHRIWKKIAVDLGDFRPGQKILDLAGGTGDLAARISPIVGEQGQVVLSDINGSMLQLGQDRLLDEGFSNNTCAIQADAQSLPFPDNYFDRIVIGFGLRNVTDKAQALRSMFRCLKPSGRLLILEFSKPRSTLMNKLYDFYSFNILPKIGELVAQDAGSYQYLSESIRMHPNQESLLKMMSECGFERCDYRDLTNGIVAIHRGFKL